MKISLFMGTNLFNKNHKKRFELLRILQPAIRFLHEDPESGGTIVKLISLRILVNDPKNHNNRR